MTRLRRSYARQADDRGPVQKVISPVLAGGIQILLNIEHRTSNIEHRMMLDAGSIQGFSNGFLIVK
jgi:hypothetical protein